MISSSFKAEAEDLGLEGQDIVQYVTQQQTLEREERTAWRGAQQIQTEEKRKADEIHIVPRLIQPETRPRFRMIKNSLLERWGYRSRV